MKNSRLLRWGKFILALAIFFFLLKHLYNSLVRFEIETLSFQPFWLIMSFGILIGYRTLLVYPWRTLYRSATHLPTSFQASWILFQLSQVSKYLPGKVGQFVGIIALCRPLGLSKTAAIVSTLQALVIQCTLGFGIGVPVLLSPSANHFLHKLGAIFSTKYPVYQYNRCRDNRNRMLFFYFLSQRSVCEKNRTSPKSWTCSVFCRQNTSAPHSVSIAMGLLWNRLFSFYQKYRVSNSSTPLSDDNRHLPISVEHRASQSSNTRRVRCPRRGLEYFVNIVCATHKRNADSTPLAGVGAKC